MVKVTLIIARKCQTKQHFLEEYIFLFTFCKVLPHWFTNWKFVKISINFYRLNFNISEKSYHLYNWIQKLIRCYVACNSEWTLALAGNKYIERKKCKNISTEMEVWELSNRPRHIKQSRRLGDWGGPGFQKVNRSRYEQFINILRPPWFENPTTAL